METYQALLSRELIGEREFKEMRGMDGLRPSGDRRGTVSKAWMKVLNCFPETTQRRNYGG